MHERLEYGKAGALLEYKSTIPLVKLNIVPQQQGAESVVDIALFLPAQ